MGLITATIKSDGTEINSGYGILSIDISYEFNRIPWAEISFVDGDIATQKFDITDSNVFEPGREIEIKLKDDDVPSPEKTVFKGIVLKQGLQANNSGCTLIVELSDKAIKLTSNRKSAVYENIKDSAIISKLIDGSGLSSGSVEATKVEHKRIVQYYVTDWDFIICRAEVNGLYVSVKEGVLTAETPSLNGAEVASFNFGKDEIYDFEVQVDARNQYSRIESSIWDQKKQQLTTPKVATDFKLKQGNFNADRLAKIVGDSKDTLISGIAIELDEAQAWADAKLIRSRLSMLKGRLKVAGSAAVNVGDLIKLEGFSARFSGTTLVTGVRHQVADGVWTTDIQFGLSPEWFLSRNQNVVDTKAGGLLPGVNGLQIGIVEKVEEDPEKEDRVKVKVPAIGDEDSSIWSRLTSTDAGKDRGITFWPEVGDEVILGFLNDDPRDPVILGSVHSSANPSPIKGVDKNPEKGIVTKEGLKVTFNDEKKTVVISTSDDNVITINGEEKSIEIKDPNKNSILLNDKGITLQSDKDIIIKSGANVQIEGKAVEIKGNKVDVI